MTGVFVCADGNVYEFTDVHDAIREALHLASRHARVGIDADDAGARRIATHALRGMVVCRRCDALRDVPCYPLTETTALVRA